MFPIFLLCLISDVQSIALRDEPFQAVHSFDKRPVLENVKYKKDDLFRHFKHFYDNYYQNFDDVHDRNQQRRFFYWFNNAIRNNVSNQFIPKATEPKYEDLINKTIHFHEIERNLTEILTKLSHVLTQILNMLKYIRQDNFRPLPNILQNPNRFKRDVNNTMKEETKIANDTNVQETAKGKDNATNSKEIEENGRRYMPDINSIVNNEVRDRILHYIKEGFSDIKNKVESLRQTKLMFLRDSNFRIGYIIANIDALDTNINNLKSEMDKNETNWSDKKILNLYDTVRQSSNAIGALFEVLKSDVGRTIN